MVTQREDGTHYLAHHHSGNIIEVWWSDEPEIVGWVGRIGDSAIVPINPRDFTILEEIPEKWSKQLQPQPDESDENLVVRIAEITRDLRDRPSECFCEKIEPLIARHTAAKVAAAEECGWNRGAEAMRKAAVNAVEQGADRVHDTIFRKDGEHSKYDKCPHGNCMYEDCDECSAQSIRALPIPEYQGKK